jgi:hypothetical protein
MARIDALEFRKAAVGYRRMRGNVKGVRFNVPMRDTTQREHENRFA